MELKDKRSIQFELWQCCNSRCKFCYLSEANRYTSTDLKLKAVNDAISFLSDDEKIASYITVSYIGGEFFQGQLDTLELKEAFFKLMHKIVELQISGKMKEVWIMATLTIGDRKDLYDSLTILMNDYEVANKPELIDQLWIVTSYDTIGSFHTQKMLDNWDYHIKHIYELYSQINFNTCMILTQDLITKYLNDEFFFHEYYRTYHSALFFKQPSSGSIKPTIDKGTDLELVMSAKQEMEKIILDFFQKEKHF